MKNIIYLFLILGIISCGEDELSDSIVGVWLLDSIVINACPDSSNNISQENADSTGCLTFNNTMLCQNVVFNADGSVENTSILDGITTVQVLTYTVNNDNNTATTTDSAGNTNTFAVSDNTITLINPFGDCTITSQLVKQ